VASGLPEDPAGWQPASYALALRVMGFEVPEGEEGEFGSSLFIDELCEMPNKVAQLTDETSSELLPAFDYSTDYKLTDFSRIDSPGLPGSISTVQKGMAAGLKSVMCGGGGGAPSCCWGVRPGGDG